MSSSLRRGTLAATALALAVASLSACAAGNDAQTLQTKLDNAAKTVGDVKVQNVNIVTTAARGPAAVTARVFNTGTKPQVLKSITVNGSGGRVKLSPAKGAKDLTVPAGGSLALGGKGNASAVLTNAKPSVVKDGNAQPISFDLSRTGTVSLRAAVQPAQGDLAEYGPSTGPSASQGSSSSPSSTASPSGAPSGSPSGSASDSSSSSASPSGAKATSKNAPKQASKQAGSAKSAAPGGSASKSSR